MTGTDTMSWTEERVELLKEALDRRQVCKPDRERAWQRHPQCGDRQGSSPWPVGAGQIAQFVGAAPAQAADPYAHAAGAAADAGQHGPGLRPRHRSRAGSRTGREHHSDGAALHAAGADGHQVPLADRRSGLDGVLSSVAASRSRTRRTAHSTRGWPISRWPIAGATAEHGNSDADYDAGGRGTGGLDFRVALSHSSRAPSSSKRQSERRDVVEQSEQQQAGEQIFLVVLPQRDQHGCVEHAEPAGRMAREAEQRGGYENHAEFDETRYADPPAPACTSRTRSKRDR